MKDNVATSVKKFLEDKVKSLGLVLYDVEFSKKQNGMNLTLFLAKEGGVVTINDCEKVHRMADKALDELNPTGVMPYILNVSSLGLDRPLKEDKDYQISLGKTVEVSLYKSFENKKHFVGELTKFDEQSIFLKIEENREIELLRKEIAGCKLYVEI